MSAGDISAINIKSVKKNRRRKKRRTADVSSSDSSSSDPSSESEKEEIQNGAIEEHVGENGKSDHVFSKGNDEDKQEDIAIEVSDVELTDEESKDLKLNSKEVIDDLTKISLSKIPEPTKSQNKEGFMNASKIAENIKLAREEYNGLAENFVPKGKDKTKLREEYLNLLFENYGDDINRLRAAPDFTNKSLSILADALQEGIGMFDIGELELVLKNKEMEN
ncbi:BEM_collapsed_G0038670.mRNA.1.CDS.1 [Saccharomyces cerevisiae]|nr:BEM_collapsed_G0038670.mRNA.1.CDS.1 [Saccharomyces cerevisiae]